MSSIKNAQAKYSLKGFWQRLWALLAPSHRELKRLMFLIVITELSQFAGPYLLKRVIDLISHFSIEQLKELGMFVAAVFVADQSVSILNFFTDRKIFRILVDAEAYLPTRAQEKMVFLGLSYHEKENTGNKIAKIQRGVDRVMNLIGNMCWEVVPTSVQVIFTSVILLIVNWRFALVFLFFVPLFALITFKLNKDVFPYRKRRHDKYEEAAGQMAQAIININTVKSFVQEKREVREFGVIRDDIKRTSLFEFYKLLNFNLSRNLVIDMGRISTLALGVYLVWQSSITIGSLVFVFTISEKAFLALYRISRLYDRIMESSEAVDRLSELTLEVSEVANSGRLKPEKILGQVTFKDLDFSYDGSKNKALAGINLKINSDCVTALVGPSGGGKTTLARMIYRHYDPQQGQVLLDDKDLKQYDLYAFRKFIAIVPQEVEIFNASVRDNIAYAKPKASIKEVEAAARIANADEFICQLSDKYDTLVGERGVKLSGGQRQRIGIARAILANPRILIFDEATSNLDSYSEKLIQEAIEKVRRGRTMIIIAHRLSTIKRADKIVVLENGRIVEQGSHFELAKNSGGLYAKLLNLQQLGDVV
jgi:ABC-type multidrug transport system fused ATPase/permease subunit